MGFPFPAWTGRKVKYANRNFVMTSDGDDDNDDDADGQAQVGCRIGCWRVKVARKNKFKRCHCESGYVTFGQQGMTFKEVVVVESFEHNGGGEG